MSISITVHLNGKTVSAQVQASTSLVEFLREHQRLTGTHVGCDTAQCGACTVLVDGRAMKSCNMLAVQADGLSITTIEGLAAADGSLHPMQAAFRDCH
ncbi:MAG: (2Fe-2S)-binding protein, partial [Burkholderiaceae bacterium]|nr:(2Fe-2S)-binding protein [Burkholderiaceae bacterium]